MSDLKRITNQGASFDESRHFTLDKNIPPILRVEAGERFVAELEDGFGGLLRKSKAKLFPRDAKPHSERVPAWLNPLCGPIYIDGVESGDTVVVTIEKIDKLLNGTTCTVPGARHFAGLCGWEECDEMYTGIIENVGGKGTWKYGQHTYIWELKPFLGTIATAPEWEALSTLVTNFGSSLA